MQASASDGALFTDVTDFAGLTYIQNTISNVNDFQTYMSGGAAAADYDGDGWVDLYVTRLDESNILYRNLRNGTFADATEAAFGADHLASVQSNGCAWGDIDNDGDPDLYVNSIKSNRYHLFINDGDGVFTEEAIARGAAVESPDQHFGYSATFGDYDLDGFIDLHVTEWRVKNQNRNGAPHNTRLLRNLGAANPGHFEDVTQAAGVAMDGVDSIIPLFTDSQSFTSRFCDVDRDGFPDLLIASDHRTSRLFWNNCDGTFTDGTVEANVGKESYGMGSTLGDFDGDGDMDWFVTSIYEEGGIPSRDGNRLYRYEGNRRFSDATDQAGVRDGQWGWGASFFDVDHDGDLDLAMTNGMYNEAPYDLDSSILWLNDGSGVFTDVSGVGSGITDTRSGKGLLTFDYDRDGDLDLFIVNNSSSPILYRNDTENSGDWLKVRTIGETSNRDGLGAVITITPLPGGPSQVRDMHGGNNFLGQDEVIAHFGLGTPSASPIARVEIRWPSGIEQVLEDVARNQTLVAVEPAPTPASSLALSITNALASPDRLILSWNSDPGAAYEIQISQDLISWSPYSDVLATRVKSHFSTELRTEWDGEAFFRVVRTGN